jgi:YVTN family beta-propeller protein
VKTSLLFPALVPSLAAAFLGASFCAFAADSPKAGPSGYHLAATWKPGGEGGWDYLSIDPAGRRLYIARGNRVQVLNADTGELTGEVPGVEGAHGVALATDLNRGFASAGRSGKVIVFDLKTLAPIGSPVSVGKKPDAIVYEPTTKHVFAFNGESHDASVIDAATAQVVGTIPLDGAPEFAAADGKGRMYVNLEDKSLLLAINAKTLAVEERWSLAPGNRPSGLSIDPEKNLLFSGCGNETLVVFDATAGKVLTTLPIGRGVDATAFDPGTSLAFSSNGSGTLTVISDKALPPTVVENVTTKRSARTMALDPKTHAVYLAAADQNPQGGGQPQGRPGNAPGSFVILKFEK